MRGRVIDTAINFGIDDKLRALRAIVHPVHRKQRVDDKKLRLLLQSTLTHTSNCIDIGAYRGRVLAEMVRVAPNGQHIAYEQPRHIYEILHDQAGFDIYDMDGLGPYSLAQLEASFDLDEQWDYVARPG